jgi:hypothetical protein
MSQHVRYGCAIRANEGKTEVGRGREYKAPPPSADVSELVPPAFADPLPLFDKTALRVAFALFCFSKNSPTVIEDVEKRVVAEDVDRCAM